MRKSNRNRKKNTDMNKWKIGDETKLETSMDRCRKITRPKYRNCNFKEGQGQGQNEDQRTKDRKRGLDRNKTKNRNRTR